MSVKLPHEDDKEIELETWPAFVDILSSTVVTLAFAFFILVVLLSVAKINPSSSSANKKEQQQGGGAATTESLVLSNRSSEFPHLAVVSPPTMATTTATATTATTSENLAQVLVVPNKATINDKVIKVKDPGESHQEVLGEIPKFMDSRVMEVLKELLIVQQNVISQQRKVIEQQDTEIQQTARQYQSLLALMTKQQEIEKLRQQVVPKDQQAKFIPLDQNGEDLTGTSNIPKGQSNYVLSAPNVVIRSIKLSQSQNGLVKIQFYDNANYFTESDMKALSNQLSQNLVAYKSKGVTIMAKPSDYSVTYVEGKRITVDRMILLRSILINLGLNKSLITFKPLLNQQANNGKTEENYGWVQVVPNM